MSDTLVRIRGAGLGYGRLPVLKGIDLDIVEGDFLGIVGPNGAGKSTLLRGILGLLRPFAGTIEYHGSRATLRFGYVPQRETLDPVFPLTALELALMGRNTREGPMGGHDRSRKERALRALEHVGIAGLADRRFRDLSGGQQQRVLIARALALEPRVLVLDEPTNGMDLESEHALMELIAGLHARDRLTVILVSHLLNVVVNYVTTLVLVDRSRFLSGPLDEILTAANLERMYGTGVALGIVDGRRVVLPCKRSHGEA